MTDAVLDPHPLPLPQIHHPLSAKMPCLDGCSQRRAPRMRFAKHPEAKPNGQGAPRGAGGEGV